MYTRQYPIPQAFQRAIDEQVAEWERTGQVVAAPIDSPWNSPLLPIVKPGAKGKYRPGQTVAPEDVRTCLDCRGLNEVIREVDCDLPTIRQVLEQTSSQVAGGRFRVASVLDLSKCFMQIPLKSEDAIKTTFTHNGVKKMFTVAIWGMKHVPGHVQRLNERLLRPEEALPYLDDIFRCSASVEAHAEDMLRILKRITYDAGLKLNLNKCQFFKTKVTLLGRVMTPAGVHIDPAKAAALAQWERPVDGKAMQRFLGAANFNREFWHSYARVTAPLEALRNTKGPIKWTPELDECWVRVRALFTEEVLLRHIDWAKPFYLTTDASAAGCGGWLGQADDKGEIWPIVCVSKKFNSAQSRYATTRQELYSAMWCMVRLRTYLVGRHFFLRVDHKPVVDLLSARTTALTQRWFDVLATFSFTPMYLPGPDNVLADALSRMHERPEAFAADSVSSLEWEAEQRGMRIPPLEERAEILQRAHVAGHFGVNGTYATVQRLGYWWPGLRRQIQDMVVKCAPCMRFNVAKESYHPLQSIEADAPWDHVQFDLLGPLPQDDGGWLYILIVVDVLTGYVRLFALRSKDMKTVTRRLWQCMSQMGVWKIGQSDNGTEINNQILNELSRMLGVDRRFITAYHPRADGLVESMVKQVKIMLGKMLNGVLNRWKAFVPAVEMFMNSRFSARIGTTPFEAMFGRPIVPFSDFRRVLEASDPVSAVRAWLGTRKAVADVVWPALAERVRGVRLKARAKFDDTHNILARPASVGDVVFVKDQTRAGSLDPRFEGPYEVSAVHQGHSVSVLDRGTGDVLPQRFTTNQLKFGTRASSEGEGLEEHTPDEIDEAVKLGVQTQPEVVEPPLEQTHYDVERIMEEKETDGVMRYLVRWKNYGPEDDTWERAENFTNPISLKNWTRGKTIQAKKARVTAKVLIPVLERPVPSSSRNVSRPVNVVREPVAMPLLHSSRERVIKPNRRYS